MHTQEALDFLIRTLLDIAIFLMLTRFLLQWVKADFYNPVCQGIVRFTNPLLMPLRKLLPSHNQFDFAALLMTLIFVVIKSVFMLLMGGFAIAALPLMAVSAHVLAATLLSYIFWAVLIRVLMSWVLPDPYHPFAQVVILLTEPIMAPARRILPPMGGLDLSPILVLLAIQFIQHLFL